jgi:cytochrome bd-type quinol oxidase subunit 2
MAEAKTERAFTAFSMLTLFLVTFADVLQGYRSIGALSRCGRAHGVFTQYAALVFMALPFLFHLQKYSLVMRKAEEKASESSEEVQTISYYTRILIIIYVGVLLWLNSTSA